MKQKSWDYAVPLIMLHFTF